MFSGQMRQWSNLLIYLLQIRKEQNPLRPSVWDLPKRGWALDGWDKCRREEEEEEEDEDEEEGLESTFRPSSSLSELNSSSCRCSCCSSNKFILALLPVAPAVICPWTFCPDPTTRPVAWPLAPWLPLDQSMELRDFFEPWCGTTEEFDVDVVMVGGCMKAEDEDEAFSIFLSPPPSAPPPTPPLRASLKSWGSMADLSAAEEPSGCCWLLVVVVPLGIPTKWLWLDWLVNRSFISS